MSGWRATWLVVVVAGGLSAQSEWQLEGGRMQARVAARHVLSKGRAQTLELAGRVDVDFPANADGKPRSLSLDVAAGERVRVAVSAAGPASELPLTSFGAQLRDVVLATKDGDYRASVYREAEQAPADYVVQAGFATADATRSFGLLARYREGQGGYLFVFDRERREVRFERWLGRDHFVVARATGVRAAPLTRLAFEVRGFALRGFVDDRLVLRAFDGASPTGAPGWAWTGARPACDGFGLRPPMPALPSAALVQANGAARLYARATAPPGSLFVVELVLDRPHGWLPFEVNGFEPWLLQRPAAPEVCRTGWRVDQGEGLGLHRIGVGEVPTDGAIELGLQWPRRPALAGRVALVKVAVATADGTRLVQRLPGVAIRF